MQVASGEIDYSEYLEGARRADEELVQQWLENNESARTSSAILDSFYNANNAGIVGALYDIDKQISLLNDSSLRSTPVAWMVAYELARSMNNGLNGNEVFEQNAKYINDLYLNAILRGRDTLNAEQRDDVETLAYTCPYLGGNAVYRARLLHGMWHWGIHYDDLEICNGQGVFKNGISKLQEQLNMLKNYKKYEQVKKNRIVNENEVIVYPNPADNEITVAYNIKSKEAATFILYDLLGRERIKTTFYGLVNKATVNVSGLETGVYLYTLQKQDKTNFTGKLIVE
jgi:hypothetical protein